MRKDMNKVLVERSRLGGKYSRTRKYSKHEYENAPTKESMRRRHSDRKSLNENLKPLVRYLRKNVNRPWDKIFSEICENLKLSSAVQKHVRDHIPDFVRMQVTSSRDGKITRVHMHYNHFLGPIELHKGELYVCDRTGLLREYRHNAWKSRWKRASKEERFAERLKVLVGTQPELFLEGDEVFKLYIDAHTGKPVKQKALAVHAQHDASSAFFAGQYRAMQQFFKDFPEYGKARHVYWMKYRSVMEKWKADLDQAKVRQLQKKADSGGKKD